MIAEDVRGFLRRNRGEWSTTELWAEFDFRVSRDGLCDSLARLERAGLVARQLSPGGKHPYRWSSTEADTRPPLTHDLHPADGRTREQVWDSIQRFCDRLRAATGVVDVREGKMASDEDKPERRGADG
jgi:DNA-binding HxlR family transcriptional regulator